MARGSSHTVRHALRHIASNAGDIPDCELLKRFIAARDADAFRAIVLRHGPMVLAVCRSLLRSEADAEDAFQATFLVLVRRAAAVRSASLPGWLYGVAYRTAQKAQAAFARRLKHEPHAAHTEATTPDDLSWREVQEVLHEELNALSERYRVPLVLCYLQGRTLDQAAAELGVATSALKVRLERARAVLRARLVRRGLAPAALVAAAWPGAAIALPSTLLESAIQTATSAPSSAAVVALTEGVLSAMRITTL
jgi:RNA polymerase sigma factor (sigma-70 family)